MERSKDSALSSVLLATDLDGRCDRALDRAAQLAKGWDAELIVLHVVEAAARDAGWSNAQISDAVHEEVAAALGDQTVTFRVVIERGDVATAILNASTHHGCGLLVSGIARLNRFGPNILGSTLTAVLRSARVPVLMVKNRVRTSYARIVVGTDFSEPSRRALETALRMFPSADCALLNASRVPFSGFASSSDHREAHLAAQRSEANAFLDGVSWPSGARRDIPVRLELGSPTEAINSHILANDCDLAVFGTHGHGGFRKALMGSVAEMLMVSVDCDVMVVPADVEMANRSADDPA